MSNWSKKDLETMLSEAINNHEVLGKVFTKVILKKVYDDLRSSPEATLEVSIAWNGFFRED